MAKAIHPDVRIGHVHLKVADLERALVFYRDVLGFELTQRYGDEAADVVMVTARGVARSTRGTVSVWLVFCC